MMSKASFMMQDHLRRNYVMITDVSNPNTFFVRGRLPFPQGLMAVAVLFKNKRPADVYAHPYFIEKQSDPSQASPQLHLTEESQGIMKIISGLRYMRDDNTKLDNTMVFVTDYRVEVEGRMPRVPTDAAEPHIGTSVATTAVVGDEQQAFDKAKAKLTLQQRAMLRRNIHHVQQLPGGGGDAGLGLGGIRNPIAPSPAADISGEASSEAASSNAPGSSGGGPAPAAAASGEQSVIPGYSTFPTPEECAADAWVVYRFLKAAIFGRRAVKEEEEVSPSHRLDVPALFEKRLGGYTVLYNPAEVNEKTFTELVSKLQREERVVKAIVVPTRPAWRHLQVWADVFPDAELICSGDVPLVRSRGGVPNPKPATSNAAPEALKYSTGAQAGESDVGIPGLGSSTSNGVDAAAEPAEWRGGCHDFGEGVTGLSFPEVDLEAEAAAEQQRAEAAAARASATAEAARLEQQERKQQQRAQSRPQPSFLHASEAASARSQQQQGMRTRVGDDAAATSPDPFAEQRRRQDEKLQLRREMAEEEAADARRRGRPAGSASAPPRTATAAAAAAEAGGEGDLVDVLWRDASFFTEKVQQPVGLRESDADRLRVLSPHAPAGAATKPSTPVDHVQLTPTIELLRIAGDAAAEEYVLYDANSASLACTDLYHGEYSDLDPANSWMCRVWFKFMKRGNYRRTDIAPRYKWLQVLQQRSLPALQAAIEEVTRTRPIRFLLYAHGTPPLQGTGANALRQQWSLPPLHATELPRDPRGR